MGMEHGAGAGNIESSGRGKGPVLRRFFSGLGLLGGLLLLGQGCGDRFTSCERTLTCKDERADAGGAGGAEDGWGGASTGGASSSTGGASSSTLSPCGECPAESPFCEESAGECVACRTSDDCSLPEEARCLSGAFTACETDADCTHLGGAPRCDAGTCVECLSEADCGGKLCAPLTHTCTNLVPKSADICAPCEHDGQCKDGMVCVAQVFGGVPTGTQACTFLRDPWVAAAGKQYCSDMQAFVSLRTVATVDCLQDQAVCTLKDTTCEAYLQYYQQECAADADCGLPGLADGLCKSDGEKLRCTVPCASSSQCRTGNVCEGATSCAF